MVFSRSLFATIRGRLLYGTLLLTLVPVLITATILGISSYQSSKKALEESARNRLSGIREMQAQTITNYMNDLANNLQILSRTPVITNSVQGMSEQFNLINQQTNFPASAAREKLAHYYNGDFTRQYGQKNGGESPNIMPILTSLPNSTLFFQNQYIADNPNPSGSKYLLTQAGDHSAYATLHEPLQNYVAEAVKQLGIYDFFLIDNKGNVVYSYYKELDYATNLINGPYAQSKLAEAFNVARDPNHKGVYLSDFAPYLPSYEDQASFMATPILVNGQVVGVAAIQVPVEKINQIMSFSSQWEKMGMGKTGESLLVGSDRTSRSVSRFLIENKDTYAGYLRNAGVDNKVISKIVSKNSNIGLQPFKTLAVEAALKGESGFDIYTDYRKVYVLGAYQPVDILGLKWIVLAKIDRDEAFAPVHQQLIFTIASMVILLIIILPAGFYLARRLAQSINTPLGTLSHTVEKLAAGDFSARVNLKTDDELGHFAQQFDALLDDRVATLAKAEKENEQLNNSIVEIMSALYTLSQKDLTIKVPVSEDVTGAVSDGLNMMTSETAKVLRQVEDVSMQVAQATVHVRTSSESMRNTSLENSKEIELASSELALAASALTNIAQQAQNADQAAKEAIQATREALNGVRDTVSGITSSRDLIRETEKRIKRLGERTQEISTAVNAISSIADRTGILALNTSMQAVAAGEAGRAYAVVADEVKRLAESARTATQQIANLVSAIQSETVDTVDAINRAIGQVVEISRTAERAGEQMQKTDAKTSALVESVRDIARTTEQQAEVSQTLQNRAGQLQQAVHTSTKHLQEQSQETAKLVEFAQSLVESVSVFKLS